MAKEAQEVIIIGSGIVGLCTAYSLLSLDKSIRVKILESSIDRQIAGGASRYAGGFIAGGESWHNEPSRDLAKESWKCHSEMAKVLGGGENYGWRECGAIGLSVGGPVRRSAYRILPGGKGKEAVESEEGELPEGEWVEGDKEELSTEGGVGQVDPSEFCETLFRHLSSTYSERFSTDFGHAISITRPAVLQTASQSIVPSYSTSRSTLSFRPHSSPHDNLTEDPLCIDIPFDKLVIAAGPWSAQVCETLSLPKIPISNLPGHSLLIRPSLDSYVPAYTSSSDSKALPAGAVFAGIDGGVGGVHGDSFGLARGLSEEEKARGYTQCPEFFVRKNGLVYVAGENSIPESAKSSEVGLPNKLPGTVDDVKGMIDQECIGRLKRAAGAISPFLKEENGAKIERTQLCYRPISSDREPLIGFLEKDVLVATGMGPWGITLAPGSGKLVAEMVLERNLSADVSALSPRRFGIEVS